MNRTHLLGLGSALAALALRAGRDRGRVLRGQLWSNGTIKKLQTRWLTPAGGGRVLR